ncbi:MAG: M64 family metallopeptidase [Candidatus Aminicenantales bacterium]
MRRWLDFVFLMMSIFVGIQAQEPFHFEDYFLDKTMRIDYFHIGNAEEEWITVDRIFEQGIWAGSTIHLIDPFNNGRYCIKIYDLSGKLIYSKGFDSYFGEYRTTDRALKGMKRTFHETALIPFPKEKIRFTIEKRDRKNRLHPIYTREIDPSSIQIVRENLVPGVKVFEVLKSGDPHRRVDLVFVAEGYRAVEESKFQSDVKRYSGVLFRQEPFHSHKENFNVCGVFKPSAESGCDEPRHGVFKNTTLNASFNSLGSERYLLTEDNRTLRDIAAHVPYDALLIMVNHKRYGGGGIYNFYCVFTVDNQWSNYILIHELGHSFAGLADEYYTSSVAYNEFYPRGIEPVEPNITALIDPKDLKWKELLSPGVEIPTPWEKEEFDRMDRAYQEVRRTINDRIARLKRQRASQKEIDKWEKESERLSREHAEKVDAFLSRSQSRGIVGAFEGAGYSARGLYRPMLDCIMFTKGKKPYCKVCREAVIRMIRYLSE